MKITKGSFGYKGTAYMSSDNYLVIEGFKRKIYKPKQIKTITSYQEKSRRISALYLFLTLATAVILTILLGIFGVIIGILIIIFLSKKNIIIEFADIVFTDDETVTLECTPRSVKKLFEFKH